MKSAFAAVDELKPVPLAPVVAIGVVLACIAWLLTHGGSINVDGFTAVQAITKTLPDTFWAMVTICGTGVVAFGLLSPTLLRHPRWYAAGLAAAGLSGLYSNGLKRAFSLPRPASVLDPAQIHVIGETLHANAFPSGHSVTSFTLAALLIFSSRRPLLVATWALPMALLIAFSRIAVGAHWPADLAAGAAGGWVCGALGVMITRRWRFWNCLNGVRVMGLVSIGIGVSLFLVDLGYPLADSLQSVAAVVAVLAGFAAVMRPRLEPLLPWSRGSVMR